MKVKSEELRVKNRHNMLRLMDLMGFISLLIMVFILLILFINDNVNVNDNYFILLIFLKSKV